MTQDGEIYRIGVVGSRNWPEKKTVKRLISLLNQLRPSGLNGEIEIVSGGAKRGVDKWAKEEAEALGMKFRPIKPKHETDPDTPYHVSHFHTRNHEIARYCDLVFALQHRGSPGTQSTIDKCRSAGTPVFVFNILGEKSPS